MHEKKVREVWEKVLNVRKSEKCEEKSEKFKTKVKSVRISNVCEKKVRELLEKINIVRKSEKFEKSMNCEKN